MSKAMNLLPIPSSIINFYPFMDGGVLHLNGSRRIWGLNSMAAFIWCLLNEVGNIEEIASRLTSAFHIDISKALQNAKETIACFEREGLFTDRQKFASIGKNDSWDITPNGPALVVPESWALRQFFKAEAGVEKPIDKKSNYVKRCVGVPGDMLQVQDGYVYINEKKLELPGRAKPMYDYWVYSQEGVSSRVLEQAGVDLVMSGHSHMYERSHLMGCHYGKSDTLQPNMMQSPRQQDNADVYIKPAAGRVAHQGAIYLVLGSSSKLDQGPLNHPAMATSLGEMGALVVDINGPRLDGRFITDRGTIADSFAIVKGDSTAAPIQCVQ